MRQQLLFLFFFFQAEDGIRDLYVTGVQTCALPIYRVRVESRSRARNLVGLFLRYVGRCVLRQIGRRDEVVAAVGTLEQHTVRGLVGHLEPSLFWDSACLSRADASAAALARPARLPLESYITSARSRMSSAGRASTRSMRAWSSRVSASRLGNSVVSARRTASAARATGRSSSPWRTRARARALRQRICECTSASPTASRVAAAYFAASAGRPRSTSACARCPAAVQENTSCRACTSAS